MTSCLISSTKVELRVESANDARDDPNLGVLLISKLSVNALGLFSSMGGVLEAGGVASAAPLLALK